MTDGLICELSGRAFDPGPGEPDDRGHYYATCPECGGQVQLVPANGFEWRLPEHPSRGGFMASPEPCSGFDPWRPDSLGLNGRLPERVQGENTGPLADLVDAIPEPWSNHKADKSARASGRARPGEPLAEWCELAIPGVCLGRATNRHHKLLRKHGGTDDRSNTLDLCGFGNTTGCHGAVHQNPEESYRRGWLIRGVA